MNGYNCDTVRDLVPAFVRASLLPHEEAATEAHLEGCAECRHEVAIVRLIHATQPIVPAGLEARVLLAVRRPVAPRRWAPGRLAMAATVATALLGGTLALQRAGVIPFPADNAASFGTVDASVVSALGWAAAEDPLLHGASAVPQLSVEELEILLAELDS